MDDPASDEMTEALTRALGTLHEGSLDTFLNGVASEQGDLIDPAGAWRIVDCHLEDGVPQPLKQTDQYKALWRNLAFAVERQREVRSGILLDDGLVLVVPGGSERPARLVVGSDAALFDAVGELASGVMLYASERRLLKQLICGFNLAEAAGLDSVSHETKRSQFKSLARKLGGGSQAEIAGRMLFAHLPGNCIGSPRGCAA